MSEAGCEAAEALSPGHCDTFHATDEAYFDQIWYWTTPQTECGDDRGAVCKDFNAWTQAWTEITDEARAEMGIGPGTLRLSVGLEHVDDLLQDIEQALASAKAA